MMRSDSSKGYLVLIFAFLLLTGCGSSPTSSDFSTDNTIDPTALDYTSDAEIARLY